MGEVKNEIGHVYTNLTVIARADRPRTVRTTEAYWLCRCICGRELVVCGSSLRRKSTKGCGCVSFSRKEGTPQRNKLFYWKRDAKRRGYSIEISDERAIEIMSQPCFYCGVPYSSITKINSSEWRHNGIDRVNNKAGYTSPNSVPCCKNCNRAKDIMSQQEFLDLARNIAKRHPKED